MSKNDVEKIKEKLDIVEVVGSYIKIEKAGANFKAKCPFHNEKTPSFFISPDRNSYYCFGCGAKGDIFSFVQEYENLDFVGALKILADKAGVILENKKQTDKDNQTDLIYDVLEEATKFFEKKIENNFEAINYLKKRGLIEKTIKNWRVGYAPSGWKNLYDYLRNKKYTEKDIESAGLIKKGDKGDYYDRFRSRIMFPLFDKSGKVIAFSGRIFGSEQNEDVAKYLNSPETLVFKKSDVLFGFHIAQKTIRKLDFSILVEGQMDLIMAHQAGYSNTVASSGTALTENQLIMLNKVSPKIVIAYDSDNAGFNASLKAWQTALSLGMDVKIAPLPAGSDPADVIKDSTDNWKKIIKHSEHLIDIFIKKIKEQESDELKIAKMVREKIIPNLCAIESSIDKNHFVKKVSDAFNIKEDAILKDIENYLQKQKNNNINFVSETEDYTKDNKLNIEKRLFGIINWQENKENPTIDTEKIKDDIKKILAEEFDLIQSKIKPDLEEITFLLEKTFENEKILQKEIQGLLNNLKLKKLNKIREELVLSLRSIEKTGDEEKENTLLKKISDVSKQIQKINLN